MTPETKARLLEQLARGRAKSAETRAKNRKLKQIAKRKQEEDRDRLIQEDLNKSNKNRNMEKEIEELKRQLEESKQSKKVAEKVAVAEKEEKVLEKPIEKKVERKVEVLKQPLPATATSKPIPIPKPKKRSLLPFGMNYFS